MNKNLKKNKDLHSASFDHDKVGRKWIGKWADEKVFEPDIKTTKKPYYNLMMFPYPSAEGLHVGNMYAFTGSDIYGRFMRMQGYDVFEPIGLDGFGIHSENYALKVGAHPADLAKKTEGNFYRQLHEIGNAYDWSSKVETYDPQYYRFTQWLFIKLFKAGLAYRATAQANWCPSCLTVLADEQVVAKTSEDKKTVNYVCERCGTSVKKRDLTQWFFRITAYSQKLLDNLDKLDWSEKVKVAQRNWIGKSEGATIMFSSDIEKGTKISVFTTRPDTVYGVTYLALATDHPLVIKILEKAKSPLQQEIRSYLGEIANKSGMSEAKYQARNKVDDKTGVFTGFYAENPLSGKKVPIYIADYVLTGYGAGAVMGVPAHDQRDWEFASKYKIDIVEVIKPVGSAAKDFRLQSAYTGIGKLVNSEAFNDMDSEDAIKHIIKYIKEHNLGDEAKMWHLRDWIISRQRYWGPPIPMIFCNDCKKGKRSWFSESGVNPDWDHFGWYPVLEEELPVKLPYVEKFKPTGSGKSPLASDPDFVNVKCPGCGAGAKRETDVSDTFLDSSWYFLRYPSVKYSKDAAWNAEITKKWLPVDMYIGGAEHSVLHLLYSRFITLALHDMGLINFEEPFLKFRAHGLVVKDGAKMSKSKGNVVNPDEYINKFGVDTLRLYLMFCGRYDIGGDFRDTGIEGMGRFVNRVWRLINSAIGSVALSGELDDMSLRMMNKTIKKVTLDIGELAYNTAVAAMMEWVNFLEKKNNLSGNEIKTLVLMLAPFAPVMTEELWERLKSSGKKVGTKSSSVWSIHLQEWPEFDEKLAQFAEIELIVQVNGKMRDKIKTERGVSKDKIEEIAKGLPQVAKYLKSKKYKTIFVPDRIINFVIE